MNECVTRKHSRPGYGNDESAWIAVEGTIIWNAPVPMPGAFTAYSATFVDAGDGTATIIIENDSIEGDKSIFIDAISIA